jgi:hypothetical protein
VVLTSGGWERLGARAARERKGYHIGWGSVLDTYAGRFSLVMVVFSIISRGITLYLTVTGKLESEIDRAGGRMSADSA